MTEIDADLVRRKIATISRNLDALEVVDGITLDTYQSDLFRKKGTERLLQETIEAAVDTNLHLLRASGAATPTDYYESFISLGQAGIIPQELAERLAPAAGLRNRLVQEYDDIDDEIVLKAVSVARQSFRECVAAVESYVTRNSLCSVASAIEKPPLPQGYQRDADSVVRRNPHRT